MTSMKPPYRRLDLPHELGWTNRRGIMPFASERINDFNLAFLNVNEAVRLLPRLRHDGALGIRHHLTCRPQCLNMRGGRGFPDHLRQIFADRFQEKSSAPLESSLEYEVVQVRVG
jgi:hypothetical protein